VAVSRNKVCLKTDDNFEILKMSRKYDEGSESCSTTAVPKMFPTMAASLI
jgi:hypothetical protein